MPADGISLPPKKGDFGTSRWGGSNVNLHQPRDWRKGMTACGTSRQFAATQLAFGAKRTLTERHLRKADL
jgi:hypothetical protein